MRRVATLAVLSVLLVACNGDGQASDPAAAPGVEPSAVASPAVTTTPTPTPAATPATPAGTPSASPSAATSTAATPAATGEPAGASEATAYFTRMSPRGPVVQPLTTALDEPTVAVAGAAFEFLIAGPPPGSDPELSTLAPEDTEVLGITIEDGLLTVDFNAAVQQARGSAFEVAFKEQIAWTATQFDTVERVQVLVEGQPVETLWGHVEWSQPFTPDEFSLAPVIVERPAYGATVPAGDVTFSGTANVFEATVELRLVDPSGAVVEETFTTATCGTGCRGDWSHTFTGLATPGQWTLVALESDPSGGEGGGPFSVETAFTVR